MMNTSIRARTLACALLATTALASPALAQTAPEFRSLDENGVDLVRGDYVMSFEEGSIGSGKARLPLLRWRGTNLASQWDRITFTHSVVGTTTTVTIGLPGATTDKFVNGVPSKATGASLINSGNSWTYRTSDGTTILFKSPVPPEFGSSNFCPGQAGSPCTLLPEKITQPDGSSVTFTYTVYRYTSTIGGQTSTIYAWRLGEVSNSYGYVIQFLYQSSLPESGATPPPATWTTRSGARFRRGLSQQGSVSYSYPQFGTTDVTDMAGEVWRVTGSSIRRPGEANPSFSVTSSGGVVTSVARDGVTTNYARTVSGSTATMTVTKPLGQSMVVTSDLTKGRPTSVKDALNRTTSYQYDTKARLTRVTLPEGNYVQYTLDGRGNATQTQFVPKSGSGLSTITTWASFPATCTNPKTCNQPTSITDARGKVTDLEYDSTHGGITVVRSPAPTDTAGAIRPETRFSYTLLNGEYELTGTSACQTLASCAGGADEVKTTIAYDTYGNVTSASSGNGNGTLTATSTMTYDAKGDLLTLDGPLSGTADTTRYRYDAARRLVGSIDPDPDGAGVLKHRAVRNTVGNAGQLTKVELGTVNSQSDADWAAFAPVEIVETGYDSNLRPVTSKLMASGTTYSLQQVSYDAAGRLECMAQRMNPAEFGALPSDACTLDTQGSFGPDRIVKNVYDGASQITQIRTAVGTSLEAPEVTSTYRSNGQVETVTDAEGNKTTYEYDGHDRLSKTRYPSPTTDGVSSNTDYEILGYDPASNVTSFRNRANESIAFTYDNLNRLALKDLPGSEPDVTYGYDLLGSLTSASQTGAAFTFSYDALGRQLAETGPQGTVSSAWDVGGRRTRLTHPDGFYVDQDYLVTGELMKIRENGTSSGVGVLATFGYDDLRRRTSLTRGNGNVTSYSYDPASRLSQVTNELAGTTHDLTLSFGYNPANQIVSNTRSNDLYAWQGHGSGSTSSSYNGLNQLASHGGASATHDTKGNLTSDPSSTYVTGYTYSSENLLTGVTYSAGSRSMFYDPLMRLRGGQSLNFVSDGGEIIAEKNNSGVVVARYVHGPALDEPLVAYNANGARMFMHADERGSIIAGSDIAGVSVSLPGFGQVNSYDEYGNDMWDAFTRFQYAGKFYESTSDLLYSRARHYNPRLGRFMQPDPIGYDDGMNVYAYVRGDPINGRDPDGLLGLADQPRPPHKECDKPGKDEIVVCGDRLPTPKPEKPFPQEPAAPTRQPTRGPDGGGSPQGGESEACKILRENSESTQGALPGYVTNNKNWNSSATLRGYQNFYRSNVRQWRVFASTPAKVIIGIGSAIVSATPFGRASSIPIGLGARYGVGGLSAVGINSLIADQLELNRRREDAIQQRLNYLNSGCR